MKYRTLSIDPGTQKVGISDLELLENQINIILTEQYVLEGKTKEEKLNSLYIKLDRHLTLHPEIDDISTEATFVIPYNSKNKVNIKSPLGLSMARGVIYAVAGKHGKPVIEYDNTTHKKRLTGEGDAKKTQIIRAIETRLKRKVGEDEAMSVSIGYCHVLNVYQRQIVP